MITLFDFLCHSDVVKLIIIVAIKCQI